MTTPTPPTTMHAAFLADILAHPDDDTPRLIYADWLEDQDTEDSRTRGNFTHTQVALAAEVRKQQRGGNVPDLSDKTLKRLRTAVYNCRSWMLAGDTGSNFFAWFQGFPREVESPRGEFRRVRASLADIRSGDLARALWDTVSVQLEANGAGNGGWCVEVRRGFPCQIHLPLHEWALYGGPVARANPLVWMHPDIATEDRFLRDVLRDNQRDPNTLWWQWDYRVWEDWARFHSGNDNHIWWLLVEFGRKLCYAVKIFEQIMNERAFDAAGFKHMELCSIQPRLWDWGRLPASDCLRWFATQALRLARGQDIPTREFVHTF